MEEVILGGIITFLSTLFFTKRKEKNEYKQKIVSSRPEFDIVDYKLSSFYPSPEITDNYDFEAFVAKIENTYFFDDNFYVEYNKDDSNIDNWCCVKYVLKNKGKTDITYLNLVSNNKKTTSIFPTSLASNIRNCCPNLNFLNYSVSFDKKKIRMEDTFSMCVFYHKDRILCGLTSAPLSLVYKDDNGNWWEQPLWSPESRIYESTKISHNEFQKMVDVDDAIKCFKNPFLW